MSQKLPPKTRMISDGGKDQLVGFGLIVLVLMSVLASVWSIWEIRLASKAILSALEERSFTGQAFQETDVFLTASGWGIGEYAPDISSSDE